MEAMLAMAEAPFPARMQQRLTEALRTPQGMLQNVVAAGLAKRCEIQIAYAIGVAHPVSIMLDTQGTGIIPDEDIAQKVKNHFDFRPEAIISRFGLRQPIFRRPPPLATSDALTSNSLGKVPIWLIV